MYADDTQLYVDFPRNQPCDADIATRRIEACTTDIKHWMTSQPLLLNENKIETVVFHARNARVPHAITTVNVCGCHISPQPTVRNIGIFVDNGMDMSMQVARTCQAAYFQLHHIAKIRHYLTIDACKTIVHGLVTSKLDYGNAVFMWHQWTIVAETATSAKFGGACNYAAAEPRPPPHHASVASATLAAIAHNIQDTGFDLPSDARPSARIQC